MKPKYYLFLLVLPIMFWVGCEDEAAAPDCTALATASTDAALAYTEALMTEPTGDHSALCDANVAAYQAGLDASCDGFDQAGVDVMQDACDGTGGDGDGGDGDDGEDYGDGECTSDADCVDHYGPGWTCEGEDWMTSCTEGEGGCTSDADCQEGEFCLEGECMI